MAFLPRAGKHAAGPVWPLPAVPAAWHQAEPLIKLPRLPSAHRAPTEPGPGPSPWGGATGGLPEGVGSSSARRGDRWERPRPDPGLESCRAALPDLWPQSPHRRAGGSRGVGGR